ncbi:hypothetical protein [Mesorhizobium japonicum]|uniref:hypothetical protein n=1 Tax=Mesorhizobium japonicum TaxID=2066070 RepID=UPI001389AF48|nr:hypothetical protein [Mesorhizobium japonicum]
MSSRNQLAAPQWAAASRAVCGREDEHDAKLEQEAYGCQGWGLAQAIPVSSLLIDALRYGD